MAGHSFAREREALARCGLEPTLNRLLVLAALAASDHPLAAKEVHSRVLTEHKLNRVTVYRILDLFARRGAVTKLSSGEGSFCYCAGTERRATGHVHFHCLRCGDVRCVSRRDLPLDEERLAASLPMDIRRVELRLDGICERCKAAPGDQGDR